MWSCSRQTAESPDCLLTKKRVSIPLTLASHFAFHAYKSTSTLHSASIDSLHIARHPGHTAGRVHYGMTSGRLRSEVFTAARRRVPRVSGRASSLQPHDESAWLFDTSCRQTHLEQRLWDFERGTMRILFKSLCFCLIAGLVSCLNLRRTSIPAQSLRNA